MAPDRSQPQPIEFDPVQAHSAGPDGGNGMRSTEYHPWPVRPGQPAAPYQQRCGRSQVGDGCQTASNSLPPPNWCSMSNKFLGFSELDLDRSR